MTLADCNGGDIVAVDDQGATLYYELGKVLRLKGTSHKIGPAWGAMVTPVDPHTLITERDGWTVVDHTLEVLCVVESGDARRAKVIDAKRAHWLRLGIERHDVNPSDEVDPMFNHGRTGGTW